MLTPDSCRNIEELSSLSHCCKLCIWNKYYCEKIVASSANETNNTVKRAWWGSIEIFRSPLHNLRNRAHCMKMWAFSILGRKGKNCVYVLPKLCLAQYKCNGHITFGRLELCRQASVTQCRNRPRLDEWKEWEHSQDIHSNEPLYLSNGILQVPMCCGLTLHFLSQCRPTSSLGWA